MTIMFITAKAITAGVLSSSDSKPVLSYLAKYEFALSNKSIKPVSIISNTANIAKNAKTLIKNLNRYIKFEIKKKELKYLNLDNTNSFFYLIFIILFDFII